ncbi:bifunctional 2-polyprenyl-6-hydroxyphenol methylase/3-demethylubiquinol 3-O-methyltransferase UbiG [Sphingobacterium sp. BIGb0116]|uniref:class I SAM-dependent methyltransferase n=1 Tax=Sphingobacterium sp. BIGb0116 TaxID=2940619 RepID=UPI00216A1F3A|nr:class I SAM-dependent methyltransferase [Sphingobacterium sp. BIGb0116]MCS4165637.1 ubiquinone/menaquinone biosynthesis C-methylase UbiE [Sphingobacterium sp. BIGb0116]
MNSKQLISRDIELFYNRASEETRLDKGMGVFEFERIKSLVEKYIPTSSSKIIDIGGGTGKYSEWLAKKGHQVHLVEPVAKHIQIAQNRANRLKNKFFVHLGEARKLEFPDNYADLIILHGPLYHLQKKEDRDLAICEAKRILKNDGIILSFAINYTASTLVGLLNGLIHKKPFFEMCKEELIRGMHNPPDDFPWLLAEAFYHKPQQLKDEFINQGLTYLNTYAVEGMAWLDKEYFTNMLNNKKRRTLMELIQVTENDSYLLPFSPHMMIAVQKKYNYGK